MKIRIIEQYHFEQVKETDVEVTGYETPETERNRYVAEFQYKKRIIAYRER